MGGTEFLKDANSFVISSGKTSVLEETHCPIFTYKHPARSTSVRSQVAYFGFDGTYVYNGMVKASFANLTVFMGFIISEFFSTIFF
jgi:hypothetical protein